MSNERGTSARDAKLYSIFKLAIEAERAAQKTYREALEYTDNPVLQKVLRKIYSDEVRHEERLLTYYAKLRQIFDTDAEPT
jgi:rubrerythrin